MCFFFFSLDLTVELECSNIETRTNPAGWRDSKHIENSSKSGSLDPKTLPATLPFVSLSEPGLRRRAVAGGAKDEVLPLGHPDAPRLDAQRDTPDLRASNENMHASQLHV